MRNAKGGKNMANPTYEVRANDAASDASVTQFNIDRAHPGRWKISFNNPPINMFVPSTIVELGALMTDLEADPSVKVEDTMTRSSATQRGSEQAADKTTIRPFQLNVPEAELTGLRRRINSTRWPDRETVTDESQGVPPATIQELPAQSRNSNI
jgi:hypothetical protein